MSPHRPVGVRLGGFHRVPQRFVSVALRHPDEYPLYAGRIASSEGLDVAPEDGGKRIDERQVPHSHALHATLAGRPYLVPPHPHAAVPARAGVGVGATEAPRGLLWHRYPCDENGIVREARIVPPTSQNLARIEEDLRHSLAAFGLEHDDASPRRHGEQVIRNYDPCISCSTHFLNVEMTRR